MRDIFICNHHHLLQGWKDAFPRALIAESLHSVPINEPVLFWLHANVKHEAWLMKTMEEIVTRFSSAKMVVLTNSPSQAEAFLVMNKGAVGYCHAYADNKVLTELKTVVNHGGIWLGRDLLQTLITASKQVVHNSSAEAQQALGLLTPREQEVALQAANGLSNKEIARQLSITERTVKAHISSSLDRLGLKDRLQLALVLNHQSAQAANTGSLANSNIKKKLELAA